MEEESPDSDPLIAPCNCSGSTALVHIECLTRWVTTKMKKQKSPEEGGMYELQRLFCEICKKKFPKLIIKGNKKYSLLSFLENDTSAFIQIQSIHREPLLHLQDFGAVYDQEKMYISFQEETLVKVGRQEENGVMLTDGSVSRQHASLELAHRSITIHDRGSKYGTLIEERDKRVRLGQNQMRAFQVGPVALCLTRKTHI